MEISQKAKRQEASGAKLPVRKIVLAVIALVIVGAVLFIGVRMYQGLETLRDDLSDLTTGDQAGWMISDLMGVQLPETATDIEYRSLSMFDALSISMKFTVPPDAYTAFIANANPDTKYGKCLVLPLQPEGTQPMQPECYQGGMNIRIDKGNPQLWRVEIRIQISY